MMNKKYLGSCLEVVGLASCFSLFTKVEAQASLKVGVTQIMLRLMTGVKQGLGKSPFISGDTFGGYAVKVKFTDGTGGDETLNVRPGSNVTTITRDGITKNINPNNGPYTTVRVPLGGHIKIETKTKDGLPKNIFVNQQGNSTTILTSNNTIDGGTKTKEVTVTNTKDGVQFKKEVKTIDSKNNTTKITVLEDGNSITKTYEGNGGTSTVVYQKR